MRVSPWVLRIFGLRMVGLLGALELTACASDPEPPAEQLLPTPMGKAFQYPLDDVLRLQHVQVRGTHNSYHVDTHDGGVAPWAYTHAPIGEQVERLGIRQIELDVNYDDLNGLEVFHVPLIDAGTRCRRFADCLTELRRFSDAYPGHLPLYIQIEPKTELPPEEMETFFTQLEGEILAAFPRPRILTPDEVQGDAPTLREAIRSRGWPTLGKLRGRVYFAFDTSGPIRTAYTHGKRDLRGRLLFIDSGPDDPFAGVAVLNDPGDAAGVAAIKKAVAANLLVRTRADSDTDEARAQDFRRGMAALGSGAHFISTDFPETTPAFSYHFEVPGGTPARCNPLTAPATCTSLALEDPAFVGSGKGPAQ